MTITAADQLAAIDAQMAEAYADWQAAEAQERQAHAAALAASDRADEASEFILTAIIMRRRLRPRAVAYQPSTPLAAELEANYEEALAEQLTDRDFREQRLAAHNAARQRMISQG